MEMKKRTLIFGKGCNNNFVFLELMLRYENDAVNVVEQSVYVIPREINRSKQRQNCFT